MTRTLFTQGRKYVVYVLLVWLCLTKWIAQGIGCSDAKRIHDPKSFEHVETRSWLLNNGATLRVQMTYRGNNAFGNPTIETMKEDFDMDGNFIRIVE